MLAELPHERLALLLRRLPPGRLPHRKPGEGVKIEVSIQDLPDFPSSILPRERIVAQHRHGLLERPLDATDQATLHIER